MNSYTMHDLKQILEDVDKPKKIVLEPLTYKLDDLEPVLPKSIVDYHYTFLSQGYVDRYNQGTSKEFNFAGAYLHSKYWAGFQKYSSKNKPRGPALLLINRIYGSFAKFVNEFVEEGSAIEGSGWVYLAKDGKIKTIKNHSVRQDIVVNIDCWEHSFDEYGKYKKEYLRDIWQIIDWDIAAARL